MAATVDTGSGQMRTSPCGYQTRKPGATSREILTILTVLTILTIFAILFILIRIIEGPLGGATPPPFYFRSARQFQGGEIKHAIHSRQYPQDDMDSRDSVYTMDPKTSRRHAYDISCRHW